MSELEAVVRVIVGLVLLAPICITFELLRQKFLGGLTFLAIPVLTIIFAFACDQPANGLILFFSGFWITGITLGLLGYATCTTVPCERFFLSEDGF